MFTYACLGEHVNVVNVFPRVLQGLGNFQNDRHENSFNAQVSGI